MWDLLDVKPQKAGAIGKFILALVASTPVTLLLHHHHLGLNPLPNIPQAHLIAVLPCHLKRHLNQKMVQLQNLLLTFVPRLFVGHEHANLWNGMGS